MLLDIIVPHAKEPWEIVRPFFDIINSQKGVDFSQFRVFLIHDGTVPFPRRYFEGKPAQVIQRWIPQKGVSAARNEGLRIATADWVVFCDCDDCYASIYSLKMIFHVLKQEQQFDVLWSPFYMNMLDPDETLVKKMDYNPVFIHNKYYRRSFLEEHNIRFCEDLYFSEDSAFNAVVLMEIGEHRTGCIAVQEPLYAWCRRPGSITTDNGRWISNTYGHLLRNKYVLEERRKRNLEQCDLQVCRTLTDAWAMIVKISPEEKRKGPEDEVAVFYRENREEFLNVPEEHVKMSAEASEKEFRSSEKDIPGRMGFYEWLDEILAR